MVDKLGVMANRLECNVLIILSPWVQRFMVEGRGGERKREWMNMVSGQKSNLECISFVKLFLTMAAGSCFPVLTGCPIISCAFSTPFSFSLAYSQSPLRIINMRAFLGG